MIWNILAGYGLIALAGTLWLVAFGFRRRQLSRPKWTRYDQEQLDQIYAEGD